MDNLEFLKQSGFLRGFQKQAFPLSALAGASKVLPNIARAGAKLQPFNIARQAAQATSSMQPFNIARRAAQQVAAGRTVGRPLAPYQGFSFAHNGARQAGRVPGFAVNPWTTARNARLPYAGGTPESIGRLAAAGGPWWKMGLGQGGRIRNAFSQGMSSPYIKYPALAAAGGGLGLGINQMAAGGMTPDGYKSNWAMFKGGEPEMMPPMMPPSQIPSREWFNENQMYA